MTDAQWYYAEDGEQQGPVSLAELRSLVTAKRVKSDDLVWCDGMANWLPSAEVAELSPPKQKPKPVRKAGTPDSKLGPSEPKAEEPKPAVTAAADPKPAAAATTAEPKSATSQRSEAKPVAPPVQELPSTESFPNLGTSVAEDEPDEPSEPDEIDELAEELFARPKFPTKRPRNFERESRREAEREPDVIRETTREVVVMQNADGQLSTAALFVQLLCWATCGLAVLAAAVICAVRWFTAGSDSSSTLLLGVAIGSYVLAYSAQRCLEILAAVRNK